MTTIECPHIPQDTSPPLPATDGCEECLASERSDWVHLRLCQQCGHVGCCDSSPGLHATAHFHTSDHGLMRSFEPGEDWWFCYPDDVMFVVDGSPSAPAHSPDARLLDRSGS